MLRASQSHSLISGPLSPFPQHYLHLSIRNDSFSFRLNLIVFVMTFKDFENEQTTFRTKKLRQIKQIIFQTSLNWQTNHLHSKE